MTYEFVKQDENIVYEHANRSNENKIKVVKNPINRQSRSNDFAQKYRKLIFREPKSLYDKIISDSRGRLPKNEILMSIFEEQYINKLQNNLENVREYSPAFIQTEFFTQNGMPNNSNFTYYQYYMFLIIFINFVITNYDGIDFMKLDKIETIYNWCVKKNSDDYEFIINGPNDAVNYNPDYINLYNSIISLSNSPTSIIEYQQSNLMQQTAYNTHQINDTITRRNNAYDKLSDEARKYNIIVDSARGVIVSSDTKNNLLFNCGFVDLGDPTEQDKTARYEDIDTIITSNIVNSKINTKKLEEIFNKYSRVKIIELVITSETFITSLDVFPKLFLVFNGISCSERTVYNTFAGDDFKIGGSFVKTSRGYEFKPDVEAVTYRRTRTKVEKFELYITNNPGFDNDIVPNEYILRFTKDKIYQYPIIINDEELLASNLKSKILSFMNYFSQDTPSLAKKIPYVEIINPNIDYLLSLIRNRMKSSEIEVNIPEAIPLGFKFLILKVIRDFKHYEDIMETIALGISVPIDDVNYIAYMESTYSGPNITTILRNIYETKITSWNPENKTRPNSLNIGQLTFITQALNDYSYLISVQSYNNLNWIITNTLSTTDFETLSSYIFDIQRIFESELSDEINDFAKLLDIITKLYVPMYDTYVNNFTIESNPMGTITIKSSYVAKELDLLTGTIDGKYFRVNHNTGVIVFDDAFTIPDKRFILSFKQDLMLLNHYDYDIVNGLNINNSFMYSEFTRTIQNVGYIIDETAKFVNNPFKFNNYYNGFIGTEYLMIVPDGYLENFTTYPVPDTNIYTRWSDINISAIPEIIPGYVGSIKFMKVVSTLGTTYTAQMLDLPDQPIISFVGDEPSYVQVGSFEDTTYYEYYVGYPSINIYYEYHNLQFFNQYESEKYKLVFNPFTRIIVGTTGTNSDTFTDPGSLGTFGESFIPSGDYISGWIIQSDLIYHAMLLNTNNELELLSGTTNYSGNVYQTVYGTMGEITIQEWFGNLIIYNGSNIVLQNSVVDNLNDLDGVTITGQDSGSNEIRVLYTYLNPHIRIMTKRNVFLGNISEYEIITIFNNSFVLREYFETDMTDIYADYSGEVKHVEEMNFLAVVYNGNLYVNNFDSFILNDYSETINQTYSNNTKAIMVPNFDISRTYWNMDSYINVLMNMPLPISVASHNTLGTNYILFDNTTLVVESNIEYLSDRKFNVIYSVNSDVQTIYSENILINSSGMYKIVDGVNVQLKDVKSLIVNLNYLESATSDNIYSLVEPDTNIMIPLQNINGDDILTIQIMVADTKISGFILFDSNASFICQYSYEIQSEQPIYVSDYEIIFSYEYQPGITTYVFNNVSIGFTKYQMLEILKYYPDPLLQSFEIRIQSLYSMKYSNIPAVEYNIINSLSPDVNISNLFYSKINHIDEYFGYSGVAYNMKIIDHPKYVDSNGYLLMMINKNNQNVITGNIYIRSQYSLIPGSYNISNRISDSTEYIMESIDKNLLLVGNIDNIGYINDLAIRSETVNLIPTSSRLLMSVEFS